MRLWSAAIVAVGLVWAAPPQVPPQTQPAPPVFRAGVDVVQLEVSIFDAGDELVHGLTKDAIEVYEDGKRQDIVDLREISIDDGAPMPVWARAVRPDVATNDLADRRLIGIVMDDLNCCSVFGTAATDRGVVDNAKATAEFIIDGLGPHDLATVALLHEKVVLQPFTNDLDALRRTIGRFLPTTDTGCRPIPPLPRLADDMQQLLAMSPQPLKAVVVISSSSGAGPLPYCPPRIYTMPDTGQRRYATVGPDPGRQPDPLSLPPVPIYTFDITGRWITPSFWNARNRSAGRPLLPGRDVAGMVAQMLAQNDSYYLLGFRTSRPTTDGKYRRLDIKVPGHKDYSVRSRAGYLRPKPAPKPGSSAAWNPELARPPVTVGNLLPRSDITVEAAAAAFAVPGTRNNAVVVALDITHSVTEDAPTGSEQLDLRTVVYAASDPKMDLHRAVKIDVPSGIRRVGTSLVTRLDLAPDRYELWLTAHDGRTTRIGSVSVDLEVTDAASHTVSLSGVVLGSEPADAAHLPKELAGLVPIVPITSRLFAQGQDITAFFQIYQGRTAPVAPVDLKIRVIDDQGVAKVSKDETLSAERFATNRAADYRLKLPLESLMAGRYLLSLEARVGAMISPKRDVPFSVR